MPKADLSGADGQERILARGGRRKSLKRLNPDKEIKVISFDFL
jgi:hypothetical protein